MAVARQFGNALICDAVYRDAESGKPVIAGVFSGDILTPSFPLNLRAALYIEFWPDDTGRAHNIDLQILLGKRHIGAIRATLEAAEILPFMLTTPAMDIVIDGPKKLKIRALADGGRPIILIQKNVVLRALPSPSPAPPAS